jgi:hypothetical protein
MQEYEPGDEQEKEEVEAPRKVQGCSTLAVDPQDEYRA